MSGDKMILRETSQPTLSGYKVGVSDIWERELPDEKGVMAPRLSARLTIYDPASEQTRREDVFAGTVLSLGEDSYYIVDVAEGQSRPGSITVRKLQ
jgi:hypothetical protein